MKYCFFLLIGVMCYISCFAQRGKTVRVKAGEDLAQAYSPQGFYRFAQFSKAVLYFNGSGRNSGVLFNYNMLSGTMQFINPNKDTLDIANTTGIDSIVFENTVFVYKDGFMEVVAGNDSIKLLKKLILKTQVETIGAYGLPSSTASVTSIKSLTAGTGVYNLIVNQDVVIDENIGWFFASGSNVVKATKTNLLKLLPANKSVKAEIHMRENKTSFEKEADLKRLIAAIMG